MVLAVVAVGVFWGVFLGWQDSSADDAPSVSPAPLLEEVFSGTEMPQLVDLDRVTASRILDQIPNVELIILDSGGSYAREFNNLGVDFDRVWGQYPPPGTPMSEVRDVWLLGDTEVTHAQQRKLRDGYYRSKDWFEFATIPAESFTSYQFAVLDRTPGGLFENHAFSSLEGIPSGWADSGGSAVLVSFVLGFEVDYINHRTPQHYCISIDLEVESSAQANNGYSDQEEWEGCSERPIEKGQRIGRIWVRAQQHHGRFRPEAWEPFWETLISGRRNVSPYLYAVPAEHAVNTNSTPMLWLCAVDEPC